MRRLPLRDGRGPLVTGLFALAWSAGATSVGLSVNALRGDGLPLIAPFPYELDCPDKLKTSAAPIAPAQARALLTSGRALLVDARPVEDYQAGHPAGARSLPYSFVTPVTAAELAKLPAAPLWIVYCDTPEDRLAGLLAEQIRRAGHPAVRVLRGGLDALGASARSSAPPHGGAARP